MTAPRYDVVLFGATSFVGQITARYLFEQFGVYRGLRWAAAGRSMPRLETLRGTLGPDASGLPLVAADAHDEAALARMCATTRVVASTVGPYALHGEPLVRACVETGTGYCDLTGEVHWIRRMIERYEGRARETGARIVHCCGFDSIPSDLGVLFVHQQARQRLGVACPEVKMRVRAMKGGISGGTAASMMNLVKEVSADPALRRVLQDPYALCPTGSPGRTRQHTVSFVEFDDDVGAWVAPFLMSAINTRIVHRSNALLGGDYGSPFRYDEAVLTGRGWQGRFAAVGLATGLAAFTAAGALAPTRWILERLLPAAGDGPGPEAQAKGFFDLRFAGKTPDGRVLRARVSGDRDPGYGSTAKMFGQAAACLALEASAAGHGGGFWTPATLLGDPLIQRLRAHAGITFEEVAEPQAPGRLDPAEPG